MRLLTRRLEAMRSFTEREEGVASELARQLNITSLSMIKARARLDAARGAQVVIQEVARLTQAELEFRVSELVTLAQKAVFPEPYALKLKFEARRGRTEADLLFSRNGNDVRPEDASGTGTMDIGSFALRLSLWSLARPRSRPTFVMDEPFRMVQGDLREKVAGMVRDIVDKLGIQVIILTHDPRLAEAADKVFRVTIKKGRSAVKAGNPSERL